MRKPLTFALWQIVILTTMAYAFLVFSQPSVPPVADVMDNRPMAIGSPVEMMDRFDCWNGNPPADMVGVMPNHVIIRMENTDTVIHGGRNAVSKAFAQVFDNAPTEHVIYGFCR